MRNYILFEMYSYDIVSQTHDLQVCNLESLE
jgi:hypothetical protein